MSLATEVACIPASRKDKSVKRRTRSRRHGILTAVSDPEAVRLLQDRRRSHAAGLHTSQRTRAEVRRTAIREQTGG
jgi:hypothetical protein